MSTLRYSTDGARRRGRTLSRTDPWTKERSTYTDCETDLNRHWERDKWAGALFDHERYAFRGGEEPPNIGRTGPGRILRRVLECPKCRVRLAGSHSLARPAPI